MDELLKLQLDVTVVFFPLEGFLKGRKSGDSHVEMRVPTGTRCLQEEPKVPDQVSHRHELL